LVHGTVVCAVAKITDGYNTKEPTACLTMNKVPTPATPSCTVWADPGPYGGATVKWSSNGTLSRKSVISGAGGGTYNATATRTNSDGKNISTQSRTCGMTIKARPTPWGQPSVSTLCGSGPQASVQARIRANYPNATITWGGWGVRYVAAGTATYGVGVTTHNGNCYGVQAFAASAWKVTDANAPGLSLGAACPADKHQYCTKYDVTSGGGLNQANYNATWVAAQWYSW
ncbi:MAG: hypothetical protein LBH13_09550, partial [Cellulomonadaceae bacterium]|nr:hypothetical protein [Cellulomonadaceae bacterium]